MKIAMIFDGMQIGGIERVGCDYTRLLQELGHSVTVFNLRPDLTDMERELDPHCRVVRFHYPRYLAPHRFAALIKYRPIGKFVYPVSFAFMKLVETVYRPIVRGKKKELKEKYDIAIAFSGHVNDLTIVADSFINARYKVAWLHGAEYGYDILSPGYMQLYKKIRNLVSLSNLCDADYYKVNKKNKINKRRIYNPVFLKDRPIDQEKVEALKEQYGDFTLMVARMAEDKDHETVLRMMKYLKETYGFSKKLLFVGDGKKENELKEYAKKLGVDQDVIFVGKSFDVQNYYTAASVYVHSSPLEGLPTVLLEAMFYNLPIAATDSIPGVGEILGNDKYGLISAVGNEKELGENVYRLYTDKELRDRMVENGRKRIKDFYPETIKEQLQEYFDTLVD